MASPSQPGNHRDPELNSFNLSSGGVRGRDCGRSRFKEQFTLLEAASGLQESVAPGSRCHIQASV